MHTILAGLIETQERADHLMAALQERGVAAGDMEAFYLNPPGQHGKFPIGGDRYADPDARDAPKGQAAGAAIGTAAGLAAGGLAAIAVPPLAPAVIAGVTGVGALVGSVAGAVSASKASEKPEPREQGGREARRSGLMVAVRVTPHSEQAVLETLRAAGAVDIERALGEWRAGGWADFDPLQPPHKVDLS